MSIDQDDLFATVKYMIMFPMHIKHYVHNGFNSILINMFY